MSVHTNHSGAEDAAQWTRPASPHTQAAYVGGEDREEKGKQNDKMMLANSNSASKKGGQSSAIERD